MRRQSIITGLALALTFGVTAVASAQGQNRQERPRGAQADSGWHRGPGAGRGGRGPEGMLLRGITLSEQQKTQLAALGEKQRKEFGAKRPKGEKGQGRNGQARPERQRGDTTGMGARRAEMEKRRDQRIASVRAILNGDQRVQFDKNVAEMKQRFSQRGRDHGQRS